MDQFLYDWERVKKNLNEKETYSSHGSQNELKLLEQTLLRINMEREVGIICATLISDVPDVTLLSKEVLYKKE